MKISAVAYVDPIICREIRGFSYCNAALFQKFCSLASKNGKAGTPDFLSQVVFSFLYHSDRFWNKSMVPV